MNIKALYNETAPLVNKGSRNFCCMYITYKAGRMFDMQSNLQPEHHLCRMPTSNADGTLCRLQHCAYLQEYEALMQE